MTNDLNLSSDIMKFIMITGRNFFTLVLAMISFQNNKSHGEKKNKNS